MSSVSLRLCAVPSWPSAQAKASSIRTGYMCACVCALFPTHTTSGTLCSCCRASHGPTRCAQARAISDWLRCVMSLWLLPATALKWACPHGRERACACGGRERERYQEGVNEPDELLFSLLEGVDGVMSLMSGAQCNSWGVHQERSDVRDGQAHRVRPGEHALEGAR
jgi:hypothetical protein